MPLYTSTKSVLSWNGAPEVVDKAWAFPSQSFQSSGLDCNEDAQLKPKQATGVQRSPVVSLDEADSAGKLGKVARVSK